MMTYQNIAKRAFAIMVLVISISFGNAQDLLQPSLSQVDAGSTYENLGSPWTGDVNLIAELNKSTKEFDCFRK